MEFLASLSAAHVYMTLSDRLSNAKKISTSNMFNHIRLHQVSVLISDSDTTTKRRAKRLHNLYYAAGMHNV